MPGIPAASGGLPQGQGARTKYSRSWSGSVARIAIKSDASARRVLGHRQRLRAERPRSSCASMSATRSPRRHGRATSAVRREAFAERDIMEDLPGLPGSIRFDARELHHLAPLFGFVGDELAKVGG